MHRIEIYTDSLLNLTINSQKLVHFATMSRVRQLIQKPTEAAVTKDNLSVINYENTKFVFRTEQD